MELLTRPDYDSLVLNRFSTSNYELVDTKLRPLPSLGFLTLADYSVLVITVKLNSSKEVSELSFIVKTPPKKEVCAEFVSSVKSFYKEPLVYSSVLKDISKVCGKLGPDCILTQPEKVIILDNVFSLGYKKRDIHNEFDVQLCELVLDALAKLHAGSLILEESKGEKIQEKYGNVLFETIFSDETDHRGFEFMCTGINTLESLFATHFTHFPREVIKDTMKMIRNLPFKLKPSENFRNVFSHGGVWSENVLFDYGLDGSPVDVLLTDFTQARYAPPALDVLLFLHLTTTRAFRQVHQGALLTHYYLKLAKEVQAAGLDLAKILSWWDFEVSVLHYQGVAIAAALLYIPVTHLPGDVDDRTLSAFLYEDRSEQVLAAYGYDESFRRRLNQALVEALEVVQFRGTGRRRSSYAT